MRLHLKYANSSIKIDKKYIAAGGEGSIHRIYRSDGRKIRSKVAKMFIPSKPPSIEKLAKVNAMVEMYQAKSPSMVTHKSLTWPQDLIIEQGKIVGFTMNSVEEALEVAAIYDPAARERLNCYFSFKDLAKVANDIAKLVDQFHQASVVVGDLNHKNFLVDPELRTYAIDLDSVQLKYKGKQYYCEVGMPEFQAPELRGKPLAKTLREASSDVFSLAVLIYYLIYQGIHPYTGVVVSGDNKPTIDKISEDLWPFKQANRNKIQPPPAFKRYFSPELSGDDIWRSFSKSFTTDVSSRPPAGEFQLGLSDYLGLLNPCSKNVRHSFPQKLRVCPWCAARTRQKNPKEFFPKIKISERQYQMMSFKESIKRYKKDKLKQFRTMEFFTDVYSMGYDQDSFSNSMRLLRSNRR